MEARPDLDVDGGSLRSGDRLRAGHVSHTPLLHQLPLLYHLLLSLHFSELHQQGAMTHTHLLRVGAHHWKAYYFKQRRKDRITSTTDTENIWVTLTIFNVKE